MIGTEAQREAKVRPLAMGFLVATLVVAGVLLGAAKPAHANAFLVNSTEDAGDNNPGNGTCATAPFQVGTEPNCTLRAAIQEANANNDQEADKITFDPLLSGTITLTLGQLEIANGTPGSDDLIVEGPGAGALTVSGNDASRVFFINQTAGLKVSGLTISNGRTNAADGGAIYNQTGRLTLTDSTVTGSTATKGGGIYNHEGVMDLTNTTVSGNSASNGGGIYNLGYPRAPMRLTDSTVSGNTATDSGGGIYQQPGSDCGSYCTPVPLEVISTTVSGNSAAFGGGIYSGVNSGGDHYNWGDGLWIAYSTVSGNTATDSGGGIYSTAETSLILSTASDNTASNGAGGGIYNSYQLWTIYSTVSDNSTSNGGGIYSRVDGWGHAQPTNTLVARNTATVNPDASGTFDSQGYNLIGDITGASGWIATDLQNVDPLLGPLQDNGGPTNTHALLPGSPAINAIGCPAWPLGKDQRGVARPQGAACDIGAYERINNAPVADKDIYSAREDTTLNVPATQGVLQGDIDPDGDALTVADPRPLSAPSNGTLTLNQDGSFAYTPKPNFNGTDSFTYKASDKIDQSDAATVTFTVTPINDAPSFTKGPNQTVAEDSGAKTVSGWATNLSKGAANEASQTLSFLASNTNTALFSVQPAVSSNGTLTYKPRKDASGKATVTLRAKDDGGVADGGVDTSAARTFTITVTPVNDAPTLTPISPAPGSETQDRTPLIRAKAKDIETNLAEESIEFFVDGINVPPSRFVYDRERDVLSHTPTRAMGLGSHTVKVVAWDAEDTSTTRRWGFKVVRGGR